MLRVLFALLLFPMSAFAQDDFKLLAIGDSILAFHNWTDNDIPTVAARALNTPVVLNAKSGARFSNDNVLGKRLGRDIREQYVSGDWDVVLMNGGANDLLMDCNCSRCDAVLDGLISPTLTGEIPAYVQNLRRKGHKVVYVGYFPSFRLGPFKGCGPFITELDARMERFAATQPGVTFWDSGSVIDKTDRSLFAIDGIHPSRKASRKIGQALAPVIAAQ